jgi:hypothetical protein
MTTLYAGNRFAAADSSWTAFGADSPEITTLASGGFVIVWATGVGIKAQMFDRNGAAAGDSFFLSAVGTGPGQPTVTALASGGFVASWATTAGLGGDNSGFAVAARIFDSTGQPAGSEFLVNTTTFASQQQPSITALVGGGFVVAWSDQNGDGSQYGIMAQVYNDQGTKIGGELHVNTITALDQVYPVVHALPDGRFIISWIDTWYGFPDQPSSPAFRAQVFDALGQKTGGELQLEPGTQYYHDFAVLHSGNFVLTWITGAQTSWARFLRRQG